MAKAKTATLADLVASKPFTRNSQGGWLSRLAPDMQEQMCSLRNEYQSGSKRFEFASQREVFNRLKKVLPDLRVAESTFRRWLAEKP